MEKSNELLWQAFQMPPARKSFFFLEGNSIPFMCSMHRNLNRFCFGWSFGQHIHPWQYVPIATPDPDHVRRWNASTKRIPEINKSKTSDHRARIWLWLLFNHLAYYSKNNRTYYITQIPQRCGIWKGAYESSFISSIQ